MVYSVLKDTVFFSAQAADPAGILGGVDLIHSLDGSWANLLQLNSFWVTINQSKILAKLKEKGNTNGRQI